MSAMRASESACSPMMASWLWHVSTMSSERTRRQVGRQRGVLRRSCTFMLKIKHAMYPPRNSVKSNHDCQPFSPVIASSGGEDTVRAGAAINYGACGYGPRHVPPRHYARHAQSVEARWHYICRPWSVR